MSRNKILGIVGIPVVIVSLTILGGYMYKDHQDKAKSAAIQTRMMNRLWGKPCHYAPESYNRALAEGVFNTIKDTHIVEGQKE